MVKQKIGRILVLSSTLGHPRALLALSISFAYRF